MWFQKIFIPIPRWVIGNSKGEGLLKAIDFKGKYNPISKQYWTFSRKGYRCFLEQQIILISFQNNGSPGLEKCPTPPPTAEKGRMLTVF